MWRLAWRFYFGTFVAALFTNAVAVYLLHDVDSDRIGQWNLAYRELAEEFLLFAFIVAGLFLLFTWLGKTLLRLPRVSENSRLALSLGIALILIQYPVEFTVRLITRQPADRFLMIYMLLSPLCCAAIVLVRSQRLEAASRGSTQEP